MQYECNSHLFLNFTYIVIRYLKVAFNSIDTFVQILVISNAKSVHPENVPATTSTISCKDYIFAILDHIYKNCDSNRSKIQQPGNSKIYFINR